MQLGLQTKLEVNFQEIPVSWREAEREWAKTEIPAGERESAKTVLTSLHLCRAAP